MVKENKKRPRLDYWKRRSLYELKDKLVTGIAKIEPDKSGGKKTWE